MAAENPPKLWVYLAPAAERDGAHGATGLRVFANGEERRAIEGRALAGSYHLDGRVSPVQVYLREDIVSADVASLAATWGVLQAKHEAETAALLARVNATEAARVVLREDVAAQREAAIQAEWVAFRDEVDGKLAAQVEINAALHDYSDEITVRICQMAEDLGLKSEPLEVGPDAAEVLSAIHDVLEERDALRRERDALREHLRIVLLAFEEETSQGDGIREEHAPGYEAAKVAAGKGVG